VNSENERNSQKRLEEAREIIIARREPGIVYLKELPSTPESRIATIEAINAAESQGECVIFICADGTLSWFA
jgi:predicted transcriptional regulator